MDTFAFKEIAWLGLFFILGGLHLLRLRKRQHVLVVPFAARWSRPGPPKWTDALALIISTIGFILLTFAIARPQRVAETKITEMKAQPCDVVIAIDASPSMLAVDYEIDGRDISRLELLKPAVEKFIAGRPADRIGIVVFSGRAFTLMVPTLNHARLTWVLQRLKIDRLPQGTAIGDGLGLALANLADVRASDSERTRSAFIVLVSDGSNNAGMFQPRESAAIAKHRNIPIYTIGVGTSGSPKIPYMDTTGEMRYLLNDSGTDEGLLWTIANETGGAFFRGANVYNNQESFKAIGQLRTIEVPRGIRLLARELYLWFAAPGIALLFVGLVLSYSRARHAIGVSAKALQTTFVGSFVDYPRMARMAHRR
jgi:Ca-activated chloride channel family protein